jgi:transposase-like protein
MVVELDSVADVLARMAQMSSQQREIVVKTILAADDLTTIIAALESEAERSRRCPHCQADGAWRRGTVSGLARYRCRSCRKTYNALTGSPLAHLRMKDQWLNMADSLVRHETVRKTAGRCGVHKNTALRWRHRFLEAAGAVDAGLRLGGVIEADVFYMRPSEKGSRRLSNGRDAWRRGGPRPKDEPRLAILTAVERGQDLLIDVLQAENAGALRYVLRDHIERGAIIVTDAAQNFDRVFRKMGVHHERVNLAQKRRINGPYHVQTVNSVHSRLRTFFEPFNGVATKYLKRYLSWFRILVHHHAETPVGFFSTIARGAAMAHA